MSAVGQARAAAGIPALARAFAAVLAYPHASPIGAARACAQVVAPVGGEAARLIEEFVGHVEACPLGSLQEAYTRAFDLDTMSRSEPTCYPYVGHYLFDESHKRGAFILGLRKRFRAAGFADDEGELADHLVVLLRFLAECSDAELVDELVGDAVLPALRRMALASGGGGRSGGDEPGRDAYLGVLRALELSLGAGRPAPQDDLLARETEREWLRDRDSLGISRDWCGH